MSSYPYLDPDAIHEYRIKNVRFEVRFIRAQSSFWFAIYRDDSLFLEHDNVRFNFDWPLTDLNVRLELAMVIQMAFLLAKHYTKPLNVDPKLISQHLNLQHEQS